MAGEPVIRVVAQREENDCAIAALAMLTGASYEDVLRAVTVADHDAGRNGLVARRIAAVATMLGTPVSVRRTVDYDTDAGLVLLDNGDGDLHALMLIPGYFIDTTGMLWEPDTYLRASESTFSRLLVPKGRE